MLGTLVFAVIVFFSMMMCAVLAEIIADLVDRFYGWILCSKDKKYRRHSIRTFNICDYD